MQCEAARTLIGPAAALGKELLQAQAEDGPLRLPLCTDFRSGLWRLNIAAQEQGRGYGRFAVESVAAEIRRRGDKQLYVTWHTGPNGPEGFYLALGFRTTGETSGGQAVGVLDLS